MAEPDHNSGIGPWARLYNHLLSQSELNRELVLNEALRPAEDERSSVLSLAQCLEQPSLLLDQVGTDYPDNTGTRAARALCSVLQQDLALSVIAPLTLRLFRDGQTPLPDAKRIFLAPMDQQSQTTSRWFQMPGGEMAGERTFVQSVGEITAQWYPVFRRQLGVSPGAYWSSIGLGLGAPFQPCGTWQSPMRCANWRRAGWSSFRTMRTGLSTGFRPCSVSRPRQSPSAEGVA